MPACGWQATWCMCEKSIGVRVPIGSTATCSMVTWPAITSAGNGWPALVATNRTCSMQRMSPGMHLIRGTALEVPSTPLTNIWRKWPMRYLTACPLPTHLLWRDLRRSNRLWSAIRPALGTLQRPMLRWSKVEMCGWFTPGASVLCQPIYPQTPWCWVSRCRTFTKAGHGAQTDGILWRSAWQTSRRCDGTVKPALSKAHLKKQAVCAAPATLTWRIG